MKLFDFIDRHRRRLGFFRLNLGMMNIAAAVGLLLRPFIHGADIPEAPLHFAFNLGVGLWLLR